MAVGGVSRDSTARSTTRTEEKPKTSTGADSPTRSTDDAKPSSGVTTRTASGNAVLRDDATPADDARVTPTATSAIEARRVQSFDPRVSQLRGRAETNLATRGATNTTNTTNATTMTSGAPPTAQVPASAAQHRRSFSVAEPATPPSN
ncbi:hypothetical protein L6R52_33090, partial [Myxococcota bacterium]|nr:hypothetical protein [Myxococcota bacterium]